MDDERRLGTVRRYVVDMVALESHIEEALDRQVAEVTEPPAAAEALRRYYDMVRGQRDALRAHLESLESSGGAGAVAVDTTKTAVATLFGAAAGVIDRPRTQAVSKALHDDYTAFNHAAVGYEMLYTTARILFDARTCDRAQAHWLGYAAAAQEINRLLPDIVAWELQQDGLGCACTCPTCSLGACICVQNARDTTDRVWRETAQPEPAGGGITVPLPPRAGSPLERAGGRAGDVIVSVDGQPVATNDAIQGLVRAHQPGDDVRLQIKRGNAEPELVVVRV